MKHTSSFQLPLFLGFLLLLVSAAQGYAVAPIINTVGPVNGSTAGGTPVVINGVNLNGATSVTFGGTAATTFTVLSAGQINATTPAHAAGTVTVSVTTSGGTANWSVPGFTYITPLPTVSSVSPSSGSTNGGTSVTITGTSFTGATSVTFGGSPATGVTVVNATTITATTPARPVGAVNVAVTTPAGTGTGTNAFSYALAPTVSAPTTASITTTTATLGGTVVSDGGATITERGVVYAPTATSSNPQLGGTGVVKVTTSGTTGAFTVPVTGLASGTSYSFKAYATTSVGTSYSTVGTFTTNGIPSVNLSVTANSGTEGDTTAITVMATAGAPVSGDQTVALAVSGTGVTSGDYVLTGTTITITDGQTTGSVTFTATDDTLVENTETATLTISAPSSGIVLGSTTQNIATCDNQFVGCGRTISDGQVHGWIHDLVVNPDYQNEGIGTKILHELVGQLKGVRYLGLLCAAKDIPFYEKNGFQGGWSAMNKRQKTR